MVAACFGEYPLTTAGFRNVKTIHGKWPTHKDERAAQYRVLGQTKYSWLFILGINAQRYDMIEQIYNRIRKDRRTHFWHFWHFWEAHLHWFEAFGYGSIIDPGWIDTCYTDIGWLHVSAGNYVDRWLDRHRSLDRRSSNVREAHLLKRIGWRMVLALHAFLSFSCYGLTDFYFSMQVHPKRALIPNYCFMIFLHSRFSPNCFLLSSSREFDCFKRHS